jgi:hypothetical protein
MTTIVIHNSNVLSVKYSFTAVIEVICFISEFVGSERIMTGSLLWGLIVTNGCNQDNETGHALTSNRFVVNLCVHHSYFSFLEPCHRKWVK